MTYWQDSVVHQFFSQGWELNTLSGPALEICQQEVDNSSIIDNGIPIPAADYTHAWFYILRR